MEKKGNNTHTYTHVQVEVEKIVYIDRPVVQEVEKIVYIDRPFEVVREVLSTENVFSYQNVFTGAYNSSQGGVHTHTLHGKILKNAPLFPSYKCTCTGANASEGVYKTSVPYVFFTGACASDGGYKTSVLYVFFTGAYASEGGYQRGPCGGAR